MEKTSHASHEVSILFEPGPLGLEVVDGTIKKLLPVNKHAKSKLKFWGVDRLWKIERINGEPFSSALFEEVTSGSEQYLLTFTKPSREQRIRSPRALEVKAAINEDEGHSVALEIYPQDKYFAGTQVQHWTVRVGPTLFEFEVSGFHSSSKSSRLRHHKFEPLRTVFTGLTHRYLDEITNWCKLYALENPYDMLTNNCQDFTYELCGFLGEGFQEQLPWTQRRETALKVLATGGLFLIPIALDRAQTPRSALDTLSPEDAALYWQGGL